MARSVARSQVAEAEAVLVVMAASWAAEAVTSAAELPVEALDVVVPVATAVVALPEVVELPLVEPETPSNLLNHPDNHFLLLRRNHL